MLPIDTMTPSSHAARLRVAFAVVGAASASIACSRSHPREEPVSVTRTTSAPFVTNHEAIVHLMEASCTRVAECGAPDGEPKRQQPSNEECMAGVGPRLQAQLGADTCPLGLASAELDRCLKEVQTEPCGGSLDPLARPACRVSEMCHAP
jgi:hypothetical protein